MGAKLNLACVWISFLLFTCAPAKKLQKSGNGVSKEDYIKSYKIAFIYGCINSGTSGNLNKFFKDNNDLGLFTEAEVLAHQTFNEADSLGKLFSKRIKPINYIEAGDRKPYFAGCIYLGMSKEVDSLAVASYEQMIRNSD
jgi:hypothetical protein